MARLACLLGVVFAYVLAANGQKTPIRDALEKRGLTQFLQLARAAGITEPAPNAMLTVFAPTNQAIDVFVKEMKLSMEDIKQRPSLTAAVVGYHVLPRIKGRASDVKGFNRSQPLAAITADGTHYLQFYIAPGNAVVLQDVQNNTANVLGNGTEVGNTMLYSIDKVLLSGDVFLTLADLLKLNPEFALLRELYTKAGLDDEVLNMRGEHNSLTVFAPTAAAVKSAEAQLSKLSKSNLQDVLRYHIVPAALPIPAELQAGQAYPTAFKGHTLRFKYINVTVPVAKNSSNSSAAQKQQIEVKQTVEIIPEAGTFGSGKVVGSTAPTVTIANLFANRMVIHGINQVLKPTLPNAASSPSKPPAAKAPASQQANAAAKSTGRKVLQFRTGTGPSVTSSSLTATQSSIRAAVSGNQDVSDATSFGRGAASSASQRCWNCIVNRDFDTADRFGH